MGKLKRKFEEVDFVELTTNSSLQHLERERKIFGYTPITNVMMLVIITSSISSMAKNMFLALLLQTDGAIRSYCSYSREDWSNLFGISENQIGGALTTLVRNNMIFRGKVVDRDIENTQCVRINRDIDSWLLRFDLGVIHRYLDVYQNRGSYEEK